MKTQNISATLPIIICKKAFSMSSHNKRSLNRDHNKTSHIEFWGGVPASRQSFREVEFFAFF